MYLVKLAGMVIGVEILDNMAVKNREDAGFTVEKISD